MIARVIQIAFLLIFAVANAITVIVSHNIPWSILSAIISGVSFWCAFILFVYEIEERQERREYPEDDDMIRPDYGREEFQEIGRLSSMLPAYIRQCCRATYDGTDAEVLEAYRLQAYKIMLQFRDKYPFIRSHIDLLTLYSPSDMWGMIGLIKPDSHDCLASTSSNGMPKRACLHCHYVGKYLDVMRRAGHVDKATGKRYGKNGLLEKK